VQACRQSFGERKVYYWEEGKLSEFTPANYNRPSCSITVQTFYKKTREVSREGEPIGDAERMPKLSCGFEEPNAMRIISQMQLMRNFQL